MLNLITPAQEFSICMRCQYRMLRAKSSQGRQRPTPNTQQLRRLILTARRRQEHVADSTSPDHGETGRVPIRYLADDILRREQASFKDSLGMDVLGTPAEVLILRDDARRRLHSLTMPTVEARHDTTQVSISSSDLLKDIDAERGIIGTDHVCENIDNVRRSWAGTTNLTSGPVTKLAYGDLISRLQDGFKLEQLTEYLARRRNSADDVLDLNIDFTTTLFSRSSWKARGEEHGRQPIPPKTSQPTKAESLAGPFATRERRERNVTRKRVVIERILRECWSIKHRDNDPPLGEMDIRLQPTHLKLITNHKRDILKQISHTYDSKVEAWPNDRIIRITSDYDSSLDMLKLFIRMIENVKVGVIDLYDSIEGSGANQREKLDDGVLRQVEEYTSTVIEPEKHRKELHVHYLGPDESDWDGARWLIKRLLAPKASREAQLVWGTVRNLSKVIPVPVNVGNQLSFVDRDQGWSRWSMASKRKVNEDHGADPKTQGNPLLAESQHAGRVSRFFSPLDEAFYKTSQDVEPYWASLVKYRDTMLLGQVLFPTLSASTAAASLSGKRAGRVKENMFKQKCAGIQREFVPLFPGMLRSLQALGTCKAGEYLLIRMIPSNDNELPVPIEVLPDLEIAIFGDENTIFVKHVRLVTSSQLDFLLPENFMDLRFIRERSIYRSGSMRLDPSLDLFLENSNLNIFSAEPLKTPSVLRLSIPTHSISSRKSLADLPNSLSVQFTSAGIEHRSELRIPYLRESSDSWAQLRYTSIEAGRFGGRRDELCLKDKERLPFYPTWSRSDHEYRRVRSKSERINDDERIATLFNKANVLVKDLVTAQNTHPLSKLQQELVIKKAPTGFLRKIHWEPVERDMVGTGFSSKIRPVSVGRMIHPIRLA